MKMKRLIPKPIGTLAWSILNVMPMAVEVYRGKSRWLGKKGRFEYQAQYIDFNIKPADRVLDIGSGGNPFPYATVLVDRFLEASRHRYEPFVTAGKPLLIADIQHLPFRDKCFDFVYCSHLLEHVDSPVQACKEIMRVGKRGYVETPAFGKDALFAWAKNMHKWHVVAIQHKLCFFEYSPRQLEGIRSLAWRNIIFSKWHHPLQEAFYNNQDIFNVMFTWHDSFDVFVFRLDGAIEVLNDFGHTCRYRESTSK